MTAQGQQTVILDRRTYLIARYNQLLSKIGPHAETDLKDIISLAILHVQITETIEALAAREPAERSEVSTK